MNEKLSELTTEQALALIDRDRLKRVKQCGIAIAETLKKYNCEFDVITIIQGNRVIQRMDLVSR